MVITSEQIRQALDDLVSSRRSREELSRWAGELNTLDEINELEFDPPNAKKEMCEAIDYLLGCDLKVAKNEYLHCIKDFEEFRNSINLP